MIETLYISMQRYTEIRLHFPNNMSVILMNLKFLESNKTKHIDHINLF